MLIVWGQNDEIFGPAGAEAYLRDLDAELHLLDTGHFALEEDGDFIAERIRDFLGEGGPPLARCSTLSSPSGHVAEASPAIAHRFVGLGSLRCVLRTTRLSPACRSLAPGALARSPLRQALLLSPVVQEGPGHARGAVDTMAWKQPPLRQHCT